MAASSLDAKYFQQNPDFIDSFDYVLFDCDGTLWIEDAEIEGTSQVLHLLRKQGKKVFFVTNGTNPTISEYQAKIDKILNFETLKCDIFSASFSLVQYLKSLNLDKPCYLLGNKYLEAQLITENVKCLPIEPATFNMDGTSQTFMEAVKKTTLQPEVAAVVVTFDARISYPKIMKSVNYLKDPKCLYVASSDDDFIPTSAKNVIVPGPSIIVAAISKVTGRQPIIVGKPSPIMFDCIRKSHPDIEPAKCLMIGDSFIDILFGRQIGAKTILTLSGTVTGEELSRVRRNPYNPEKPLPDFVVSKLSDLLPIFAN